jgi:hypothetical protein
MLLITDVKNATFNFLTAWPLSRQNSDLTEKSSSVAVWQSTKEAGEARISC